MAEIQILARTQLAAETKIVAKILIRVKILFAFKTQIVTRIQIIATYLGSQKFSGQYTILLIIVLMKSLYKKMYRAYLSYTIWWVNRWCRKLSCSYKISSKKTAESNKISRRKLWLWLSWGWSLKESEINLSAVLTVSRIGLNFLFQNFTFWGQHIQCVDRSFQRKNDLFSC